MAETLAVLWAWIVGNWAVILPILAPLIAALASLLGKFGRIGNVLRNTLNRLKDGDFSDRDKIDTMDDLIAIFRGPWFNKTQTPLTRGGR